jgi:hypothetical protein
MYTPEDGIQESVETCTSFIVLVVMTSYCVGRFQPFIGHKGPWGEQRYSSTLFLTSALEGGGGVSVTPRPHLTPRKEPVPILQEAGWASGPVWTGAENLTPHRDSIPGPSSP